MEAEENWLEWIRNQHIPDVLATNLFTSAKLCRILSLDTSDGVTYSIQYACTSMQDVHLYQSHFAQKLQKEHSDKFKDQFVAFRSVMEQVHVVDDQS